MHQLNSVSIAIYILHHVSKSVSLLFRQSAGYVLIQNLKRLKIYVLVILCLEQNEFKSSPLTLSNRETTSNKSPITTPTPTTPSREKPPKIIRMSSLNEPPSPQMSLKTPIDVDADVDDDCVDNAPIIKNVRSMVENFESPNSGSGGGSGGGSSAPKQRRYSGAKRRSKFQ